MSRSGRAETELRLSVEFRVYFVVFAWIKCKMLCKAEVISSSQRVCLSASCKARFFGRKMKKLVVLSSPFTKVRPRRLNKDKAEYKARLICVLRAYHASRMSLPTPRLRADRSLVRDPLLYKRW